MQLAGGGGRSPLTFMKIEKKFPIFDKIALFKFIYGLNSHLKLISFEISMSVLRVSWRKNTFFFPAEPLFCMSYMKCLSKCPFSKKPVLSCVPATLTFHANFYSNIWIFANLPIYIKLIHDNISLVFWKSRTY